MGFKDLSKDNKIYLAFFVAGVISLFMDWVRLDYIRYNGFQQQGWIILIPLGFIVITKLTGKLYSSWFNMMLSIVVCLLTVFFMTDKTIYIEEQSYNVASLGLYTMVICTVGYMILCIKDFIKEKIKKN